MIDNCRISLGTAVFGNLTLVALAISGLMVAGCRGSEEVPAANTAVGEDKPIAGSSLSAPEIRITSVAGPWGIQFHDNPANAGSYDDRVIVGTGCAVCDLNKDGRQDIVFVRTEAFGQQPADGVATPGLAVYLQEQAGKFTDATDACGLAGYEGGVGIAVADCTNDGCPDLLLTSSRGIELWINNGEGCFSDVTSVAGLMHSGWAISATWLDFDRDGWLDLFVTNYLEHQERSCSSLSGGYRDFCSPLLFNPTKDNLYRNTSGDHLNAVAGSPGLDASTPSFQDVTIGSGIGSQTTAGMGVLAADLTGDGWTDLYVASDQRPNRLWVNQANGTFTDQAVLRGCDGDFLGRMQASMGIALGPVTTNVMEDMVVAHLTGEFHAVYAASSEGAFTDRSRETGIGSQTRPFTGFGVAVLDLNCDGASEVITANGRVMRPAGVPENVDDFWQPYQEPLQVLTPREGQYEDVPAFGGESLLQVARGLATGDLDQDGDSDAVVTVLGGPALVLRNDCVKSGNWISFRATDGTRGGRSCPGAQLRIGIAGTTLVRTLQPCQSYASTHQDLVSLGLGNVETIEFVEVIWPHGDLDAERYYPDPATGFLLVNGVHELQYGKGQRR